MSKRVLVIVTRGGKGNMTDKTPTVVYEHELPLLAEVHGLEPELVEDHEVLLEKSVQTATLKDGTKLTRKEILEGIIGSLGLGQPFTTDPHEEYSRLERVYGMHEEVRQPIVTVVYGRFEAGKFSQAVGVEALEEMPIAALRKRASELGIDISPTHNRTSLIAMIRASTAEESIAKELRERHERRVA